MAQSKVGAVAHSGIGANTQTYSHRATSRLYRAPPLSRQRRRAGMLHIAVGGRLTARHLTMPPASKTHAGQERSVANVRYQRSWERLEV